MSAPKRKGPPPLPYETNPGNKKPRCKCGRVAREGFDTCAKCKSAEIERDFPW